MIVLKTIIISLWFAFVFLGITWVLFRWILPEYKITVSEVSFDELLLALNATINTELELWEKDVFREKTNVVATNSRYKNYYHEITTHIMDSLSPKFYANMEKYISQEAVASIVARRVRLFLNEHTSSI